MQEIILDQNATIRFKANEIVRYILDNGGIDLNQLAILEFSQEDREQFAQLIGYSISGYHELSYVSDESAEAASKRASELFEKSEFGCRDTGCEIHCGVEKQ